MSAGTRFTNDKALTDRNLLGAALGDLSPWSTWLAVLRAAFGLPLDEEQRATFHSVAGGRGPPTKRVRELWSIVGRRGGKSRIAAALAVYAACFTKHHLAAGEVGYVLVLAASRDQAQVVFRYIEGFLKSSKILRQEIDSSVANEIDQVYNLRALAGTPDIDPGDWQRARLNAAIFFEKGEQR